MANSPSFTTLPKVNSLNPQQQTATKHKNGPLLILAGAGSGKTKTMTHRIAHLMEQHYIRAENILGLSFTNKAARELKDRVTHLASKKIGPKATKGLTISTFHSLCVRILRKYSDLIGYQKDFTIIDDKDQEQITRQILKQIKIDDRRFNPRVILFQFSHAKNKFLTPDQAIQWFTEKSTDDYSIITSNAYPHYIEHLKALNAMDFDDLLFNTAKLLKENSDLRKKLSNTFRYILVDEYQDTNPAQFQILLDLTSEHKNICVVGDDDQSIYSWRGADSSHILNFPKYFPDSKIITLDQNYRSTENILKISNELIQNNKLRHSKKLWSQKKGGELPRLLISEDEREEAENIAYEIQKIKKESDRPYGDFAILFRSNPQSRIFEETLRLFQIPYKVVGLMSFLDRKEIKDLLCYWRLIVNPKDDYATKRIINWPTRGIGKGSISKLTETSLEKGISFFESLESPQDLPEKARKATSSFFNTIYSLREALCKIELSSPQSNELLAAWGDRFLKEFEFKTAFQNEEEPATAERKWDNINELINGFVSLRESFLSKDSTSGTGLDLLKEYLSRLTLQEQDQEESSDTENLNQVILLTLHSAKGLEYPIVFLVGMEDGLLPHRKSIEDPKDSLDEERRLCYVGMTRAMDTLYLSRAKFRNKWGKKVPQNPSRFLQEISENDLFIEDRSASPDFKSKEAQQRHEDRVRGFLDQIKSNLLKSNQKSDGFR